MQKNGGSEKKKVPVIQMLAGVFAGLLLIIVLVFVLAILPLQNATEAYNSAVEEYNAAAEDYNSMLSLTCVDNLDGFPESAENLEMVNEDLFSVMKSFLGGNTAKKTQADIETLKEIMEYLSDDTKIMEQITAPSEAWVMERLGRVEDILEIQPVTSDNDPNGLLHRENGGYTACIYFTSTGIESAGGSPVSRGTDGGGAVEVYSTVQDAEARCEYLSGFDNTILYTGSYAIVGTMVIRISYAYTDEAQYEMTDRIAKAFTQLETA